MNLKYMLVVIFCKVLLFLFGFSIVMDVIGVLEKIYFGFFKGYFGKNKVILEIRFLMIEFLFLLNFYKFVSDGVLGWIFVC